MPQGKGMPPEEKEAIKELITRIARGDSAESITLWVKTFPDRIQIVLTEAVNEACQAIDLFIEKHHPNLKSFINNLVQKYQEDIK